MIGRKTMSVTVFAASVLFALPGIADAQETGSFHILQSYVQDYTTIDHAGAVVTGGSLVGTSTVLESSGPPFVKDENGIVRCLVFVRAVQGEVPDLEAHCTVTDSSGEELYLLARRKDGDVAAGSGGAGRFRIMGGTGKYDGLSGECPYDTWYLPEKRTVSSSKCTWQRP